MCESRLTSGGAAMGGLSENCHQLLAQSWITKALSNYETVLEQFFNSSERNEMPSKKLKLHCLPSVCGSGSLT